MRSPETSHRYGRMQRRIEALAELACQQAKMSDRLASRCDEDRAQHLLDFDRMFRCVRLAAAWLVRLDQAAAGKLRPERETTAQRSRPEPDRPEQADPRLPGLPGLPHFEIEAEPADRPAPAKTPRPAADPAPALLADLEVGLADVGLPEPRKTQSEILRQALALKHRAGPAPPLRSSG